MIRKSIFDTPSTPRLYNFLQWVRDGQLFIPEFQRPFEWDDQRRLDLLDSVSRGLPIGAFMVWRTLEESLQTYANLGPFILPQPRAGEARSFLIDGHQRLTTLFAALEPLDQDALERLQQGEVRWPVYFDLAAEDSDPGFVLAPRRRGFKIPDTWLPTNELFSPKALWKRQRSLEAAGHERLAERSEDLANAFKDYIVPVLPLVTDDIRAVTDSFVRVNSGGKPMSEGKVLRALVYADFRIDDHFAELRAYLAEFGWGGLKDQVFFNALKVRLGLDVYLSSPVDVKNKVEARGQGPAGYGQVVEELRHGLGAAARLLDACGFSGPGMLPYQYQIIALSEALLRLDGPDDSRLNERIADKKVVELVWSWLWATTYAGYFTGMTGNRIRRAIDHLKAVLEGAADPFPEDLIRRIEVLGSFRGSSTRSLALVLMMVNIGRDTDGKWVGLENGEIRARLGEAGTRAVDRIFPGESGTIPGNRVVAASTTLASLRETLARDPLSLDDELATELFIPKSALATLAGNSGDSRGFLAARTLHLRESEARFIRALGLEVDS